jgi:diguanylate cyclase (GGDEF)-like protein
MTIPLFKEHFFKHVRTGIADHNNAEQVRKAYLINIFSFVALLFVFPLGINAYISSLYPLSFALLGITFVLVLNYLYLKVTYNQNIAVYIISGLFFFLMTYLVYAGGVSNTGPLWVYPLPIILMFLLGFRKGLFFLTLFIVINSILLFFLDGDLLKTSYPYAFKVRIILSLIVVTFLASASEYLLEKSFNDMKQLKKALEYTSRQDPLTGLYNRRVYKDDICKLKSTQGIILMCDIDHFKSINDFYGHTAGDIVLVQVSECIRQNIRKEDLAIRWGGEEFFIFLSSSTLTKGYIVSEKLRKSIETLPIHSCDDAMIKVTISIGMSIVDDSVSLDEAIKNADDAMYAAKKTPGKHHVYYHELNT